MLFFGILSILLAVASAQNCYDGANGICGASSDATIFDATCNARHGGIDKLEINLQQYANYNLQTSFEYLLMSSHFGNYEAHREGFKALYRKLSDESWEDAINVLKYIGKRGGTPNFNQFPPHIKDVKQARIFELDEVRTLAKALDMQKDLAAEALHIHSEALLVSKHDPGIIHYLQEQFIEPQTERIRDLAGYTNDLKGIVAPSQDNSIGIFLFDEYLKKSL
ncbi:ferritin 2 light chain [Andrena cerasifolii]|uniref:ferritin 2 light chain n=1 Tax=Andrena cerasifolii TaxID=2819439 RepID=UPI004037F77A